MSNANWMAQNAQMVQSANDAKVEALVKALEAARDALETHGANDPMSVGNIALLKVNFALATAQRG